MEPHRLYRTSPLIGAAAVSVIIAGLAVFAAAMGLLPSAHSERADLAVSEKAASESPKSAPGRSAAADKRAPAAPANSYAAGPCGSCGVIESVRAVQVPGQSTGVGAIAGGVAGAAVGSQLGKGNGRTALGILGAVGGAYAGNAVEKNVRSQTSYRVTVRMDDGSVKTVHQPSPPSMGVGEKVRVEHNQILGARG